MQDRLAKGVRSSGRDVPMITLVSRLVPAKGMDLIVHSMENIIRENDVQFVMLGTGFFEYENFFINLNNNYPAH